ncbi:MAG: hypothetical protein JWQ62_1929, partial [Lacunisphaera sp.]|nr:hypothetical protein [Lacunisphaera sp.]
IALRPVRVFAEDSDYAKREYGVTASELKAFVKRVNAQTARDRRAGRMTRYTGNLDAAIRD